MTGDREARPVLFAGPTLHRARAIRPLDLDAFDLQPPIQRGDLPRLLARRRPPGCLILVDGLFHNVLSVGHVEIRDALAAGYTVWGMSSMGAIRAREMGPLGMRGFGRVYASYCGPGDFRDDEVALVHEPTPPYAEHSEPLVHLRAGLADLVARGLLTPADSDGTVEELRRMWYCERTLALTCRLLTDRAPELAPVLPAWVEDFDRFRVKALDLLDFVEGEVWRSAPAEAADGPTR